MMPWNSRDVGRHFKGASDHDKRIWVAVANSELQRTGDEGRAIRAANSQVDKHKAKVHGGKG